MTKIIQSGLQGDGMIVLASRVGPDGDDYTGNCGTAEFTKTILVKFSKHGKKRSSDRMKGQTGID